ncbi:MAG: EAL domain-containing protein [Beijerinckiaceae bacterium]|jgi:cyclic-di-GMP phosphodiesterase TipF (flagellum assembly factor)|nr:EAL domain-containing protein [Beijerinckiaceae bacterium]
MAAQPHSAQNAPPPARRRLPRIEPALRAPLLSVLAGIAAACGLAIVLPPPLALPVALAVIGLSGLSALLALDARRKREADALAANVGELNVRLAATRIKLDGLRSRIDSEPLREADIAPTRASLAELTAEVGLLGGVLRDVANAVSEHETRLASTEAEARKAGKTGGAAAAPVPSPAAANPDEAGRQGLSSMLVAQPDSLVDAELRKRDEARLAAIMTAFGSGGIEVHLQPVAALPMRRTVGYEALARLKLADGTQLMPSEFIAALERAGQGASLDAQVLTQVLAIAGHLNAKGHDHFISLNLSGGTWSDARALGSIARVLETFRSQSARLVIEVPQRLFRQMDPTRLGIIGAMSANGARFALDQVSDLRIDPAALADRGVCFVKAPALMLAEMSERQSGLDIDIGDLAQLLRRSGIELIGERAETDRQVADLLDIDVRLAQGFAISQPRPVKPDVFQPVQAGAAEPQVPAREALVENLPIAANGQQPARSPDQAERVPFRAVLRRA